MEPCGSKLCTSWRSRHGWRVCVYLPRLLVYHSGTAVGSESSETFKVMERRLLKAITTPAMIVAILAGVVLATVQAPVDGRLAARQAWTGRAHSGVPRYTCRSCAALSGRRASTVGDVVPGVQRGTDLAVRRHRAACRSEAVLTRFLFTAACSAAHRRAMHDRTRLTTTPALANRWPTSFPRLPRHPAAAAGGRPRARSRRPSRRMVTEPKLQSPRL